ncbi:MMPL family transporter [Actinoplanes sichuanensis]|uniref:MMPL family transporter n=1 Tax=Actinoplanes sichuanensis TaxID=512349 RepID=A0ABW4AF92_9ACTN|nr:MMPL family transporter [Actinoplanes sichuanensis]
MLIVALVAVIGSGVWGLGVFGQLTEGGYNDPRSESARAAETAVTATGGQGGDVIAIYTPDQGGSIDDAALTKRIKERLGALPESAVEAQSSYWDKKSPAYASKDKSSAVAVITLTGEDDAAKMDAYADIEDALTIPGAHVELAGGIPLAHASSQRSTDDLAFAEMVSLPIVLILLLLIFGSLVAASLPVLVGGAAVLGSLGVLHAIALTHEVNSFAVNVASLLGLGMAIDYGLFMVGRFREEQAVHSTSEAVRRTVATAGRTVVFSATLLMTALAGLLLFPQGFLKSLAYGGLAAVFLAMLLSLTLLPALLAVLGPRVDLIPIRLPGRVTGGTGGWERLAGWVLRRPVLVAVPIFAALLVLALPIAGARFGENDERQLPAGDPSRVAIETLKADYPQFASDGVQVVVHAADGKKPDVKAFSAEAAKVAGIEKITTTGGDKATVILTADLKSTDAFSDEARDAVDGLRALTPPAGSELLVGGVTARNVDSLEAIGAKLPLMIGLLAGATLVLMFLAFGSILLPIKAVVMSALSLTATFGSLVWIFQEGHGASWLDVTPTPLEAGIVVLMAAVVFGLSTDYEVFLLSRMVEARLRGSTTREAVTIGLSRTGRVISAAALLLIVVTGAFALSSVTTMRFIGVGMIIALVLDATVVRVLLVPAVLAVLGDASWWAPGPLRRLQEKAGLAEYAGEEEATGRHAWRPVDPSMEETRVLDGTLIARALPAAPAQAALPSGSETSNTVVLDYEKVLDYLSEKNLSSGTPSDNPIQNEVSTSAAEPDDLASQDAPVTVTASSGAVSAPSLSSAGDTSSSAGDTSDSPSDPLSGDSPSDLLSGDSSDSATDSSTDSTTDSTVGEPEEDSAGPDDLWAEVEATLAAGAEVLKPDTEPSLIEAYAESQSPDDFDPSATQVLHLPADDTAATQVIRLPDSDPAPEEPVIFSETVYNGLFTEETVRAATPEPEPEPELPAPDDAESSPESVSHDTAAASEDAASEDAAVEIADSDSGDSTSIGADSLIGVAGVPSTDVDSRDVPSHVVASHVVPPGAAPADEPPFAYDPKIDAYSADIAQPDVSFTDIPQTHASSADIAQTHAPFADIAQTDAPFADTSGVGSGPLPVGPLAAGPDASAAADVESAQVKPAEPAIPDTGRTRSEKSTAAEDEEVAYFLAPFVDDEEPPATPSEALVDPTPSVASAEFAPHPYEPAAELHKPVSPAVASTTYRYEPEAPSTESPYEPVAASTESPYETVAASAESTNLADATAPAQAEPIADPFSWRADPRLANLTAPEPDAFPWLDRYAALPGTPEPTPTRPEAALPHPLADRPGSSRPQTLDDWLSTPRTRPEQPHPYRSEAAISAAAADRPQSLDDWTNSRNSSARPETLGDIPAAAAVDRARPASLADLPVRQTTPDRPAPEPETTDSREPEAVAIIEAPAPTPIEPQAIEPDPIEPDPIEPDPIEPEATAPEPIEPEATAPEPVEPEPIVAEATEPDQAEIAFEPAAEVPVTVPDLEPALPDLQDAADHASAEPEATTSDTPDETVGSDEDDEPTTSADVDLTEDKEQLSTPLEAEPTEIDAWRDPAVLARSAVDSSLSDETGSTELDVAGIEDSEIPSEPVASTEPANTEIIPTEPAPVPEAPTADEPAPDNSLPDVIEDAVDETFEQPAEPSVPARRPQTLDEWLNSPTPRPQTPAGPDVAADTGAWPTPEQQPTEADYLRGRRPETLDDRIRGTVRPATLADHMPEQGRSSRRPANGGPSWTGGSGEHPYDRQIRRPASLADHPGPARPGPEPTAEEPGPDAAR